jgi:hypothetical protein
LLTSDQIKTMAGDAGWAGACELAGFLTPGRPQSTTGFDPIQMLAHFYETQPGLPKSYEELRKHAATMDIPLPAAKTMKFGELKARFIEVRKLAGKSTPPDGPQHPDDALTPEQINKLLDGAPQVRRKGYWMVLENTVDALAEYVERYESEVSLRQHHYNSVSSEHAWPASSRITECAKKHGIGGKGDSPFRAMIDLGRKRAREKRLAA